MGDASSPPPSPHPAIFNVIFGEYTFSIISDLFDNNPHAYSTQKSKTCENVSYLVKDSPFYELDLNLTDSGFGPRSPAPIAPAGVNNSSEKK